MKYTQLLKTLNRWAKANNQPQHRTTNFVYRTDRQQIYRLSEDGIPLLLNKQIVNNDQELLELLIAEFKDILYVIPTEALEFNDQINTLNDELAKLTEALSRLGCRLSFKRDNRFDLVYVGFPEDEEQDKPAAGEDEEEQIAPTISETEAADVAPVTSENAEVQIAPAIPENDVAEAAPVTTENDEVQRAPAIHQDEVSESAPATTGNAEILETPSANDDEVRGGLANA